MFAVCWDTSRTRLAVASGNTQVHLPFFCRDQWMKKLTRACLDYMQTKKRQERERKDKRKNLTAAFFV